MNIAAAQEGDEPWWEVYVLSGIFGKNRHEIGSMAMCDAGHTTP